MRTIPTSLSVSDLFTKGTSTPSVLVPIMVLVEGGKGSKRYCAICQLCVHSSFSSFDFVFTINLWKAAYSSILVFPLLVLFYDTRRILRKKKKSITSNSLKTLEVSLKNLTLKIGLRSLKKAEEEEDKRRKCKIALRKGMIPFSSKTFTPNVLLMQKATISARTDCSVLEQL